MWVYNFPCYQKLGDTIPQKKNLGHTNTIQNHVLNLNLGLPKVLN